MSQVFFEQEILGRFFTQWGLKTKIRLPSFEFDFEKDDSETYLEPTAYTRIDIVMVANPNKANAGTKIVQRNTGYIVQKIIVETGNGTRLAAELIDFAKPIFNNFSLNGIRCEESVVEPARQDPVDKILSTRTSTSSK